MKSKRQEKILELIAKYDIETQEELIAHLAECGIESKQTTVSRDIKELYLYKEPLGGGRSRYAVSNKADHIDNTKRLKLILNECCVSADCAGIVVVLKTLPALPTRRARRSTRCVCPICWAASPATTRSPLSPATSRTQAVSAGSCAGTASEHMRKEREHDVLPFFYAFLKVV